MSKTHTETESNDNHDVAPMARRGFLKLTGAGAAAATLGPNLTSFTEADSVPAQMNEGTDAEWRKSTCAGCTSWCASQILVEDGRAYKTQGNELSKIHGNNDCPRMDLSLQQLYDPDRITQPMRRTNSEKGRDVDPEFEPISWEEAIDEIADKIMELRDNEETHKFMLTRGRYTYLRHVLYGSLPKIIGSPNNISHSASCAEAEKFGPYYTEGEWSYRQYDVSETEYVLLWGADPISTNRQVSHYSNQWGDVLDQAGVAVVEPRLSSAAAKADEFMPVEPGQDGALATALAHVILTEGLWHREFVGDFTDDSEFVAGETVDEESFDETENVYGLVKWWNKELKDRTPEWAAERTGVEADQIERVAVDFAEAAPHAMSWVGGGPVMQVRGSYNSMAAHALNGLVGSVGNEGGPMYAPSDGTADLPDPSPYVDEVAQQGIDFPKENGSGDKIDQRGSKEFPSLKKGKSGGGVVTNNAADGVLEEDPMEIEMLISYWNNFAFSNPESRRWEEALAKIPFMISIETHASETAHFADILLPATHHQFERWGQLKSMANRRGQTSLLQPVLADDPNDPEDVIDSRLWNTKSSEVEIPYMIADELADRGFTNMLDFFEEQFADPETGLAPSEEYDDRELKAQAFARNAIKLRMQPLWDPEMDAPPGDEYDGWDEFREAGIWNSEEWEYRNRWPSEGGEFGTETGKFEFYSKTLEKALGKHADRHDTDVDDIMETCKYEARGEQAFIPHYEEPYVNGEDMEFDFVEHKSKLNREGRSANTPLYQEFKDVDPGDEPDQDVARFNPVDADRLDIEDGDEIRLVSPVDEITCTAKVWEGTQPGTVVKTYGQGHWAYGDVASEEFGSEPKGGNNNRLHVADYDRLSGSSVTYGSMRVDVEKL
ncbi:molybdopterin-dependent oxidoreductase [Halobacteriaceae archaeon SHR40]|uniref:molybdopterin-dependent oxidoreductase n=1 Tax=Halovenus amylolytica TaxID=2500550 RepID=UPI000FE37ECE